MAFRRHNVLVALCAVLAVQTGAEALAQTASDEAYNWPWGRFVSAILMILLFGAAALTWVKQVKTMGGSGPGLSWLKRGGQINVEGQEHITLEARRTAPSGVILQSVNWKGRSYLLAIQRDKLTVVDMRDTPETPS